MGRRTLSKVHFPSRWKPIDLLCDDDISVRAKLVRCEDTAAVGISEAISHEVLRLAGLEVAECHAIVVSDEFADDISRQYSFKPPVVPGRHWGTVLLSSEALSVTFGASLVGSLKRESDLFKLYAIDVLLANPDRRTHGNVLLRRSRGSKFSLIPIDQSDCFNHPACLRSADELEACKGKRIGRWLDGTEAMVLTRTADFVDTQVRAIQALAKPITRAVQIPPDEWYDRAGVDPGRIEAWLNYRLEQLPALVDTQYWNQMRKVVEGNNDLIIKL